MRSWVYLFSNFTSEALLLEALVIFILFAGYSAFWVLRKRKIGSIEHAIPAGLVKDYLNDLIQEALNLRVQLFGLLAQAGFQIPQGDVKQHVHRLVDAAAQSQAPTAQIVNSPEVLAKLAELETKLAEQNKAMDALLGEKSKIEKELTAAKSAVPAPTNSDSVELQKRIKELEDRLAEYSIIEDDLANLKRLQQENAQLKANLGQNGSAPVKAPTPIEKVEGQISNSTDSKAFEGLVDDIEKVLEPDASLEPPEAAAPVESKPAVAETKPAAAQPATPAQPKPAAAETKPAAAQPAAPTPPPQATEAALAQEAPKDDDLLSEFEKMLNT